MCKFAGLGRLWLFSRFYSHLLGRFCGCLWFSGYVNFVEIFGFVIVGFGGFGGFQWQWVCHCLLQWVEILRLSCGQRLLALVSWWWWWLAMGLMERGKERSVMFIL